MSDDKLTVILLAGDRGADDAVAAASGVSRKALADIGGRPMLAHTITNLRGLSSVGRILVVANQSFQLKEHPGVHEVATDPAGAGDVTFIEGAGSPVASVLKVMGQYPDLYPVLVATADTPLTGPATLRAFIDRARAEDAALAAGVVSRKTVEGRFPSPGRTFIPLKGGAYTGCNLIMLNGREALKVVRFWLDIERNRKKALSLVATFGLWTLIRVIFRRIDLADAVRQVSRAVGAEVRAIELNDPLAAMDVDKPRHLELARRVLATAEDAGAHDA